MGVKNNELIEVIVNRLFEIANVPFKYHEMDPLDRSYKEKYSISEEQYYIWELEMHTWLRREYGWKRRKSSILLKWIKKHYGVNILEE